MILRPRRVARRTIRRIIGTVIIVDSITKKKYKRTSYDDGTYEDTPL